MVFSWLCLWWCGGVFVVVFVWWRFCDGVHGVFVVVWWCFCVFVMVWWCFCGGVVVFSWCCFCDGVPGVFVVVWWCFRGGVFVCFFCQGSTFVALPRSYAKSVDNIGVKRCLV